MESAIAGDQATQARQVVERAVDALVRRDLEAYLETLRDDVVWEGMGMDYLPNGSRYEGKDAIVRDLLPTLTEVYDLETLAFDVRGIVADGPNVVVEWVVNAKTPRGRSYDNVAYCVVFSVTDGAIGAVREYTDTRYAKRVLFD